MANTQSEDKDVFDIKTINLLKSFAVICGSMIKNSINFESSIVYYKETNHIMNSTCQKENTLEKTLNHLKYYFNGKRITLLSYNQEENKLDKIVTSGNPYENASIFARDAIDTKRTVIFNGKNIDLFTNQVDTTVDSVRSQIVIHKKLKINEIFTKFSHLEDKDLINNNNSNQKRDNIIAVPLINDHAAVIGVIELVTCAQILPDDVKLLEVAAKYLSYSVMMFKDKQYNKCITEMRAKISDEDMEKALIPIVTVLDGKTLKSLPQTCFDTMQWCGSLGYKLIFNIFSFFDLQPKFGIKSKTLFSFIESLIMSYKKVTTYNWIHAIDSFQFVFSEISSIGGSDVFTDIEILALLVASLCHHIGHKEKVINEKSEIPLTILSKTQCYTEAYFCHKAIEIISKDESNIFSELTSDDFYNIWEVIIELILSLNMRKHFHLLNESKNKLKGKTYQSMNKDEKLLTLKVILKCADFSPAARPFKIADRDRYAVPEEFFRTGKLEDVEGIVFTGKERDRCHIDHVKSINSVYEKLVLPYFEIASELFPSLISNYENVMRNYNKWCSPV
ncbi:hypothetical protein TRFO_34575 [Tritrichomonas foetus]|uniref:PDEase domain-containing protein n=1 Tax=Tritrichomonas foetus TaxID=1144522 RepID=A0A1J4JL00_9EUKA|nr:hypothetical protein TRFO_34575 [Tritrichomonas foetus]|eukprot:OHS99087.1 hypothetical protein TRFO_34575 [Tritrichomonas foetus]